jgi:hypothetical protein
MSESPPASPHRVQKWDTPQIAGAVYGTISAAVIVAGWKGTVPSDLVFLLLGYVLMAHAGPRVARGPVRAHRRPVGLVQVSG